VFKVSIPEKNGISTQALERGITFVCWGEVVMAGGDEINFHQARVQHKP